MTLQRRRAPRRAPSPQGSPGATADCPLPLPAPDELAHFRRGPLTLRAARSGRRRHRAGAQRTGDQVQLKVAARPAPGDVNGPRIGRWAEDGQVVRLDPWAYAAAGRGPVTVVAGDPGTGKTALVWSITLQLIEAGAAVAVVTDTWDPLFTPAECRQLPTRPGAPTPAFVMLPRTVPAAGSDPARWTAAEAAAAHQAARTVADALDALPARGVLIVDHAWLLQLVDRLGEGQLRSLRQRGLAVIAAATLPADLEGLLDAVSRFVLTGTRDPLVARGLLQLTPGGGTEEEAVALGQIAKRPPVVHQRLAQFHGFDGPSTCVATDRPDRWAFLA